MTSQKTTTTSKTKKDLRTKCEIWTRVMGYHRPVSQYNKGKKSEYYSRVAFTEFACANSTFIAEFA